MRKLFILNYEYVAKVPVTKKSVARVLNYVAGKGPHLESGSLPKCSLVHVFFGSWVDRIMGATVNKFSIIARVPNYVAGKGPHLIYFQFGNCSFF